MRRPLAGLSCVLAAVLPVLLAAAPAAGAEPVRVLIDGAPLALDVPAQLIADRTMVPLRQIFEALGALVDWNPADGSITARRGERWVWLAVGSREARVGGRVVILDVPPVLVGDRTLVPARFVSEALGAAVAWDPATRTVSITTGSSEPNTPPAPGSTAALVVVEGPVPEPVVRQVEAALPGLWEGVTRTLAGPDGGGAMPRVTLLSDRDRYLRHLIARGTSSTVAVQIATHAAGSASAQEVEILADAADRSYRRILAHELGHVAVLRRGLEPRLPQWLHEGLVEYVAQALTVGGPRTPLGSQYWAGVRRRVLERAAQGTLESLFESYGQWIDRFDDYPAHDQAMLAVTLLAERWGGTAALTRYLDRLAAADHPTAFHEAFGVAPADFERLFTGYLYGQALKEVPAVTLTVRVPDGRRGQFAVFAPGRTNSPGWVVTGPATLTITVAPDGTVQVQGPVGRQGAWALAQGQEHLGIYFVPADPIPLDGRQVTQAGIFLRAEYGAWFWSNNTAYFVKGDPAFSRDDPAYPVGVELVELGG